MCVSLSVFVFVMCVCTGMCMCVCMSVCVYVCMYVCTGMCGMCYGIILNLPTIMTIENLLIDCSFAVLVALPNTCNANLH